MSLYKRWSEKFIERFLKERRVLVLAGCRQCGKTTLVKELASADTEYRTLDEELWLVAAQRDPANFIKHDKRFMIIDEIQREPRLLMAIKKAVDEDNRPGQFLLTGSADIRALPGVIESLAGRMKRIRLRNLSEGEIQGKEPTFFERSFTQSFKQKGSGGKYNRERILELSLRGGFPEAVRMNESNRISWHKDYIEAILERDLKNIFEIKRQNAMGDLFSVLAAWSGKFMDITAIGSTLGIDRTTVQTYIKILQAFYVVEKVRHWAKTDYDRVGKRPKIFMTDPGLMASLLNWRMDRMRFDSDKVGKVFETFIFHELSVQIDLSDGEYALYHYRDREKREIDFLVERSDGALLGIEVKAASSVNDDDFKHIEWFKKNLAKKRPFIGIVLYTDEMLLPFGEGLWAVPMGLLW